jgi:hypothetical protein
MGFNSGLKGLIIISNTLVQLCAFVWLLSGHKRFYRGNQRRFKDFQLSGNHVILQRITVR